MKQLFIEANAREARLVVMEDGRVAEWFRESGDEGQILGNIYRVRVQKVLPAMQAAFLDGGDGGPLYLYIDDALPTGRPLEKGQAKPNIRELVREGEERLVQVIKEAAGTKSPSVSTELSLPGRMLVYQPYSRHVSISRKIGDEAERKRLKQLLGPLLSEGEGAILRTQAEGATAESLEVELAYLREAWQNALRQAEERKGPRLVYRDADLLLRTIRDTPAAEIGEIVIDDADTFQRVKRYVKAIQPALLKRISRYQGKQPLFDAYGIEAQLDQVLAREVSLASGGTLVFDQTEAMTVIDVNTGTFTGKAYGQLEETVTRTNLEAAREIARQLRLRDIGGIIVIDFIDMKQAENQEKVLKALKQELANDQHASFVLGFTRLGLVEMTRKKSRKAHTQAMTRPCPVCAGRGRILSVEEQMQRLLRELRTYARNTEAEAAVIEAPAELAQALVEHAAHDTTQSGLRFYVIEQPDMPPDTYRILYIGDTAQAEEKANRSRQARS